MFGSLQTILATFGKITPTHCELLRNDSDERASRKLQLEVQNRLVHLHNPFLVLCSLLREMMNQFAYQLQILTSTFHCRNRQTPNFYTEFPYADLWRGNSRRLGDEDISVQGAAFVR